MLTLESILQHLPPSTTLVTPTRRLAQHCHDSHNKLCSQKQPTTWHRLTVQPLEMWLENLWKEAQNTLCQELPLLLDHHQETLLWESIINEACKQSPLLQTQQTAELAKKAWRTLLERNLSIEKDTFSDTMDTRSFFEWQYHFRKICKERSFITLAEIPNALLEKTRAWLASKKTTILFLGFDEFTPQIDTFLHELEAFGYQIQKQYPSQPAKQMGYVAFSDRETELKQAGHWLHEQTTHYPTKRFACISADLHSIRPLLLHTLNDFFPLAAQNKMFSISAGLPLKEYPLITHAFTFFQVLKPMISFRSLSHLLQSPFLKGYTQEQMNRIRFETHLRMKNRSDFSWSFLLTTLEKSKYPCPVLLAALQKCRALTLPKNASPTEWTSLFLKTLKILGWPGEHSLNSEEYQLVHKWQKMMGDFQKFERIHTRCSLFFALRLLTQLAEKTLFQARTSQTRLSFLGTLESAGLCFDAVWVLGCDAETWLTRTKPNPFIPWRIQDASELSHACAQRRIQKSADTVIFSYAKKKEDRAVRPSVFIPNLPEFSLALFNEVEQSAPLFENFLDEHAPRVSEGESIRGGTALIKAQAACPFQAFAQFRLQAIRHDDPIIGLDARAQGTLVHDVLAHFWKTVRTRENLLSLTSTELNNLLAEIIQHALTELGSFTSIAFQQLEYERLMKLIAYWLNYEKKRPDFSVHACEEAKTLVIGPLELQVRIDRIDRINDKEYLIIDYKTGHPKLLDWFDKRPDDPQLPLYTLAQPHIMGLLFAKIRSNTEETRFIGITQSEIGITDVTPFESLQRLPCEHDWSAQHRFWETLFTQLANDFDQGVATVDPKNQKTTCRYCDLPSLCRINFSK